MIDVFDFYQRVCAYLNTWQNGLLRPNQNYEKWLYDISLMLHKEYFGKQEINQIVVDEYTTPFLVSKNIPVQVQVGSPYDFAPLPADYAYWSSARVLVYTNPEGIKTVCMDDKCKCIDPVTGEDVADGNPAYQDADIVEMNKRDADKMKAEYTVKKWQNQQWGGLAEHPRKKPTLEKPGISQINGGFRVMPKDVTSIVLDYFKKPVKPIFAYTIGSDDEIIYNQGGSTQIEWTEKVIPRFLAEMAIRFGSFIGDNNMIQMGLNDAKRA
jgi:hypothetical protein